MEPITAILIAVGFLLTFAILVTFGVPMLLEWLKDRADRKYLKDRIAY